MSFLKKLFHLLNESKGHGYKHYSSSDYRHRQGHHSSDHHHGDHGHYGHKHYGSHHRKKHSSGFGFFSS